MRVRDCMCAPSKCQCCLSLDGRVLSSLCAKLPRKHTTRPSCLPPSRASSSCGLPLPAAPFKTSARRRDHLANQTNTLAIKHARAPRQGAQTKAASSLARAFVDKESRTSRAARGLCRNYSPRASCESVAQINWRQSRLRLQPEGRGNVKT